MTINAPAQPSGSAPSHLTYRDWWAPEIVDPLLTQASVTPLGLTDRQRRVLGVTSPSPPWAVRIRRGRGWRIEEYPNGECAFIIERADVIPAWFFAVSSGVLALMDLGEDWDSYGAPPLDRAAAKHALELLLTISDRETPPPAVVPVPNGSIQIEWHCRGMDLELEVSGSGAVQCFFEDADTTTEWDATLISDLTRIVAAVSRLSDVR
jgi:hypothetical protein